MSTPSARTGGSLDAWFKISARGSTVRQEIVAGLTTFLAMVYSVIVVPGMLGKAGFPPAAVFVSTCLVAGVGSLVMGLWANLPLAIGCAISLTAFTAFSLVLGQQISIPVALGAVFLMGVLFTVISATGIRSWILRNLPQGVAHGTGIGIGLFLLLIAANGVGLVIKNPLDGLPVALGNFDSFPVIMSLVGLAVIIGLEKLKVPGGKTGLTAVTVGVLFLLILFLSPLSYLVPAYATAPALMYVGLLMLSNVAKIDFNDFVDAMAGLITAVFIVLTCNIVTGIMIGFAALVIGRLVSGEWRKLNLGTVIIAAALVIFYAGGWAI